MLLHVRIHAVTLQRVRVGSGKRERYTAAA